MLVIPAIDLKDGQVVRYIKGRLNKKVYSDDPIAVALNWQKQGAKFLHVVDLDGAMSGIQKNLGIIKKIIDAVEIPVEAGGGIRDLTAIEKVVAIGAQRVIIGTKAIEDISFLERAIMRFGDTVALSLDASGKKIGMHGWSASSAIGLDTFLGKLKTLHLKTIIYTDITRDGTLQGINIAKVKAVLKSTGIEVIVSGGVSSLTDIQKLANLNVSHFKGVIVGKALYEDKFSLRDAIELAGT